ncbi:efflux RND transporter permease subunit, partial [Rhizobium ruizarguesonis]
STSSFGQSRVTLEFSDAIDLSVAANYVRDAICRITQNLPDEADAPQIVKADSDSSPIMRLAVTSTNLNMDELGQVV